MQVNLNKTTLTALLLFLAFNVFGQFNTIWNGVDTLYVGENCKAYFYWTNPTPENSLFVTSTSGGNVTVTIGSISPPYMFRDSVPAGTRIRIRYEFRDQAGNTGFRNINIPVVDTIPPKFDPNNSPSNITVDCIYELSAPTVEATDNCTEDIIYDFSEGMPPGPCEGGTFERIWTATDESGNQATLIQTITVNPDTVAPEFISMPQDTSVQCGQHFGRSFLSWLDNQINTVEATDQGCGLAELTWVAPDTSEIVGNCGPQEVIFTAEDSCGNISNVSAFFEIVDLFAPTITRLANDTVVRCSSPSASGALQTWIDRNGGARATDNCGILQWSTIPENPSLDQTCSDTIQVVFVAMDGCGNQSSTRANFIFTDDTPPFFTKTPENLTVQCDTTKNIGGLFGEWLTSGAFAEADDHCNEVTFFTALPGSYDPDDASTWPGELPSYPEDLVCSTPQNPGSSSIDIDFVFYDNCNNAVVQARRFTIIDSIAPVITSCPRDTNLLVDATTCSAEYPLIVPDANDGCLSDIDPVSVIWTSLISSTVPGDPEAPVDTVVLDIPVSGPFNSGSLGNVSLTLDLFNIDANESEEYFLVYDEDGNLLGRTGIQQVECVNFQEYFDQISGTDLERWITDGEVTITLIPNIPAGMSTRMAINDRCGGSSVNATLRFFAGVAGEVSFDYKVDEGAYLPLNISDPGMIMLDTGQHTVVYRVIDCQGNADSCLVTVSVFDQTPPNITCPPNTTVSLDEGSCSVSRSVSLPFGLVDNCSGLETLSLLIVGATNSGPDELTAPYRPSVKTFEKGVSTVIYTVRDSSGNQGSCNFSITVVDDESPEAICQSISIVLDPTGTTNYILTAEEINAGSNDNCGNVQLFIPPTTFDCSQVGEEIPVILRVTDEDNNADSCTAIIRVLLPVLEPTYSVDICGDDTLQLFANTMLNMGNDPYTYQWSGPNGYSSNLRNPKRPNANASYSGQYTVRATGFNGCISEGTVQVSINQFNTPILESDKIRYCSNEDVLLEATSYSGTVTYEWYEGVPPGGAFLGTTNTPNFLVRNPTTGTHRYYVIVKGNNCTTNPSAVYQIEVDEAIIAEVDDALINVCEGDRILLGTPSVGINYSYQWTGPNGFVSDRQYPPAIEPADPARHNGTYMLIISNGSCTSQPAMVEVNVGQKPPTPRIEINQIACEGDTVTLFVPNISQGERYFWTRPDGSETLRLNDNTLFVRALPSNEGQWTVRVEVDGCSSEQSAPFVLNIEEQLNFVAVNDGPVCEGDSVTLSAEIIPGATYQWTGPGNFRSNMRQVKTPAFSGIYTVELTTPNGCISTADTRVELRLVPRITALSSTGDSTCVTGVECINLTPTVFPADIGQYTYEWSGPNGFTASGSNPCVPNATEDINGVYQLVVSNGECRSLPQTTTITVFNTPEKPVLDGNNLYCVGDTLFLSAIISNPSTNWRYNWKTPGQFFQTLDPTLIINDLENGNEGYYSLVIENGPCTSVSSDSILVEIAEQPNRPVILPLPNVCEGDSVRLQSNASPSFNYIWSGPGNYSSNQNSPLIFPVSLSNAGEYRLVVEAGSCRSPISLPARLTINAKPSAAEIAPPVERICIDAPGSSIEICATPGSVTDTATYSAFSSSGQLLGSTTGNCIEIPGMTLRPGINNIYWLGNSNGCLSDTSNIITITADTIPSEVSNAGMDIETCDSSTILTAGIPTIALGSWSTVDPDIMISDIFDPGTEITGLQTGENVLFWSLSYESCIDYSSDTVIVFRDMEPLANPDAYTIDLGITSDLMVTVNDDLPINYIGSIVNGPFNGSAEWVDPGMIRYTPSTILPGIDSLLYRICPVACPDLCSEAWVRIIIGGDRECNVPTIITPNGDAYNDILVINCLRPDIYPNNKLSIFNVWGDEVFSASPYNNDWDGTYNGKPLPEGSYYFVFDLGEGSSPTAGFIIIKR